MSDADLLECGEKLHQMVLEARKATICYPTELLDEAIKRPGIIPNKHPLRIEKKRGYTLLSPSDKQPYDDYGLEAKGFKDDFSRNHSSCW